MISYKCPQCGEPMESPASQAGKVEQCPHCGELIRVAGAPATQAQAVPPDPPSNSPAQSCRPGLSANTRFAHCKGRDRWPLIVGLLAFALVGLFPPTTFVWPVWGNNVYVSAGRGVLWQPSSKGTTHDMGPLGKERGYIRIDYWRLGHEWIVIAALTGAAWVLIRTLGQRRQAARP